MLLLLPRFVTPEKHSPYNDLTVSKASFKSSPIHCFYFENLKKYTGRLQTSAKADGQTVCLMQLLKGDRLNPSQTSGRICKSIKNTPTMFP